MMVSGESEIKRRSFGTGGHNVDDRVQSRSDKVLGCATREIAKSVRAYDERRRN
jgi:hypothetical protein